MSEPEFSNPLAPASAPTFNPLGPPAESQTPKPLKNEDFRQWLLTPLANATPSRFAHLAPKSAGFAAPTKPVKKKKESKPKPKTYTIQGSDGTVYVDRAAQRRDGIANSYEAVEQELKQLSGDDPESATRSLSIEESKYLGGDMEHTHLVKGLDYALLNKVKAEIEEEERRARQLQEEQAKAAKASFGKQVITKDGRVQTVDTPTDFKTNLGRAIYKVVFEQSRPETTELFQPGRMIFAFDLDPESTQQLPTIVMYSKEDLPDYQIHLMANTHPELIKRVERAVAFIKEGEQGIKKIRKKEKAEEKAKQKQEAKKQPPPKSTIFDDVDDTYEPTLPNSDTSNSKKRSRDEDEDSNASSKKTKTEDKPANGSNAPFSYF